ncbi:MAG: hypothetical protein MAG795_00888 [Candidatus Woesearchaeota archaeon]|nr:hypothetical protein [Candidatus Woesearchaeota archaeon]
MDIKKTIQLIKEYSKIAKLWEIGRRVFAKNSFDGILTIIGIILGNYYAHITESRVVIVTGVGACIAMGVSGIWGTYFTEKAERRKKVLELEKVTLRKMKNSKIEKAENFASILLAFIDGLSPFFAALIVLIPFFIMNINIAYYASLGVAFLLLALLGAFLGMISKEHVLKGSFKMIVAGVVCMLLSLVLQTL